MTLMLILIALLCSMPYIILFLAATTTLLLVFLGREIAKYLQLIIQKTKKENLK